MKKGQIKVTSEKSPKNKTAAQLAKAEANRRAYERRNDKLAYDRQFAAYCRKHIPHIVGGELAPDSVVLPKAQRFVANCRTLYGCDGTDDNVVSQYLAMVAAVRVGGVKKAA